MTVRQLARLTARQSLAFLMSVALLAGAAPATRAQTTTGAIAGVILGPDGKPTVGFKAVLRDTASNQEFVSDPTDAEGNYVSNVPVGGRYKLVGVIASDGVTRLPVQDVPPVSVLQPGTTRLNVRFTDGPTPGVPTTVAAEDDKDSGATPWYKRPGPITGMVLGGIALVAIASASGGSGDDENEASPFTPADR
jgi:hypothetical protein